MSHNTCSIEVSCAPNGQPRGVGFLVFPSLNIVTARAAFYDLEEEERDYFRVSFEYWIMGRHDNRRFHGWNKSEFGGAHKLCFVFKQDEHRLYGFLDHPKESDPGYYFCVLVAYAWKVQQKTERKFLVHCDQMRETVAVRSAARALFQTSAKGMSYGKR